MKAPEGMAWIDVTYLTDRPDETSATGKIRGEAGMQLLIDAGVAAHLIAGDDVVAEMHLEQVIAAREKLCRGRYIDETAAIRIMEEDE